MPNNLEKRAAEDWQTKDAYLFGRHLAQYYMMVLAHERSRAGKMAGVEVHTDAHMQSIAEADSAEEAVRLGALQYALRGQLLGVPAESDEAQAAIEKCKKALKSIQGEDDIDAASGAIGNAIKSVQE